MALDLLEKLKENANGKIMIFTLQTLEDKNSAGIGLRNDLYLHFQPFLNLFELGPYQKQY